MKAIILVGGQGTRLRPLTNNTPKPLLPIINRPLLDHVLYLLRTHGITDVVLAVGYRSENFEQSYGDGSHLGVKITYVREEKPLDTGWAIKNVQKHLDQGEPFLVFNGDILTDLDVSDMLRFHQDNGSVCTISLTPVEDPSAYGVVDMDESGRIRRFTEKPRREEATSNWINAGTYILDYSMLEYISEPRLLDEIPPGRPYSVEYGLFPTLLNEGKPLFGYRTGAYWMDIGTPAKYLQAQTDLLAGRLKSSLPPEGERLMEGVWAGEGTFVHSGARLTRPVVLGKGCRIHANVSLVGPVVLGDGCEVLDDAELEQLVAWRNVQIGEKTQARGCVVANDAYIGSNCRMEEEVVVGDGVRIGEGNTLAQGTKVETGTDLPDKQE